LALGANKDKGRNDNILAFHGSIKANYTQKCQEKINKKSTKAATN